VYCGLVKQFPGQPWGYLRGLADQRRFFFAADRPGEGPGGGGQSVISIGVYYTNNFNGDTGTMAYSYTANL